MATKVSRDKLLERAVEEDAIPNELLTAEQAKRRVNREKKRKERSRQQLEKTASTARDEREWWNGNRAALSSEDLESMLAQDGYIRDLLFSMETVVDVQQSDPVLIEIVEDLVKERGTVHLGYIHKDPDIPSDWRDLQYWRDPELLGKLESEKQTAQYIRFGLLAALPDWRVSEFLQKVGWTWERVISLLGQKVGHEVVHYG